MNVASCQNEESAPKGTLFKVVQSATVRSERPDPCTCRQGKENRNDVEGAIPIQIDEDPKSASVFNDHLQGFDSRNNLRETDYLRIMAQFGRSTPL